MKKYLLILILIFMNFSAEAVETSEWQKIYTEVKDAYVNEINIDDLAIAALKGINSIDKNLRLADDNTRITLYYKGKVVKVLNKPDNKNDSLSWGQISAKIIDSALQNSPIADEKSFQLTDEMAKGMLNTLDKDSEFYAGMDEAGGIVKRNKRHWASRLLDDGVLYTKITAFNKQTYNELLQALQENSEADKLIIDVRDCPGGMAGEAIKVADLFLDDGIIASTRGKDIFNQTYYNADNQEMFVGKDIEIWTDSQTASAAEILAAALQEQGRAIIKGHKTFGKGTMQKLILLPSGGVLAITNGYFQTPSGRDLQNNGVIPDIEEDNFYQF